MKLLKQLDEFKSDQSQYQQENRSLKERNSQLEKEVAALKDQIENLKKEIRNLQENSAFKVGRNNACVKKYKGENKLGNRNKLSGNTCENR